MEINLTAGPEDAGSRIDAFVCAKVEEMSRNGAQKAIAGGLITYADGRGVKKNTVVADGDQFLCRIPEAEPIAAIPQDIPLDIVYEDGDVVVVNKARGMVVHPAPGHPDGTLVNALLHHCGGSLSGIGGAIRPGIVHRIDKDTSGLLIVAKNDRAHSALSAQLKDHSLSRIYEAVAIGRMGQDTGTIDLPIGRHPVDRKRMSAGSKVAKSAVTHYRVIGRYNGYTHVECSLETGRTHQIRVHMAHIGHPIVGDMLYGRKKPEKGITGQCLHARSLSFVHPATGEWMSLTAPLPEYFNGVLAKLGPVEE